MLKIRLYIKIIAKKFDKQKIIHTFTIVINMNEQKRIEELDELIRLIKLDLKNLETIKKKIGWNSHLQEVQNLYLDQLSDFLKERDELKKKTNDKSFASRKGAD